MSTTSDVLSSTSDLRHQNLVWKNHDKEFMKYHIPVFLIVVHCAICIPIYLLYEIVCDHCIPVSHESKLMANYKLVLGCIQAFV